MCCSGAFLCIHEPEREGSAGQRGVLAPPGGTQAPCVGWGGWFGLEKASEITEAACGLPSPPPGPGGAQRCISMRGRGRAGGSTNSKEKAFRAPGEGVLPGPRPTEDTFIFFLGGLGPFNEPVFFFSPLSGPAVSLLSQPGPFPLPPCPPLPSLLLTHRETFPWKRSLGEGGRGGSSHGYMAVGERRKKKKNQHDSLASSDKKGP